MRAVIPKTCIWFHQIFTDLVSKSMTKPSYETKEDGYMSNRDIAPIWSAGSKFALQNPVEPMKPFQVAASHLHWFCNRDIYGQLFRKTLEDISHAIVVYSICRSNGLLTHFHTCFLISLANIVAGDPNRSYHLCSIPACKTKPSEHRWAVIKNFRTLHSVATNKREIVHKHVESQDLRRSLVLGSWFQRQSKSF